MIRLHFVVEGQTEETFVRDVLTSHLAGFGVVSDVHRVTTGRRKGRLFRGGIRSYAQIRTDIELWRLEDQRPESRFTTMVNLYALPDDFPGFAECRAARDCHQRVHRLETSLAADIPDRRIIPYIQLHEFEALLFVDLNALERRYPEHAAGRANLEQEVSGFESPEHIDDGAETCPSKRIAGAFPRYQKPVDGPIVAGNIGLAQLRAECRHFGEWLSTLEALR